LLRVGIFRVIGLSALVDQSNHAALSLSHIVDYVESLRAARLDALQKQQHAETELHLAQAVHSSPNYLLI
jgi:hypothetical protein